MSKYNKISLQVHSHVISEHATTCIAALNVRLTAESRIMDTKFNNYREKKTLVKRNFIAIGFYIQILLFPTTGLAAWASDLSQWHEEFLMDLLADVQSRGEQQLKPFTTDGCSGGLSIGWQYLAKHFSTFALKYGKSPPWEYCCVSHDKIYWKGAVANGYRKRKRADQRLRQCIIQHGQKNSVKYATQTGKTEHEIEESFKRIANLMYNSVRLGGRPCSPFHWRWGYGWPLCEWESE